LYGSCFFFSSRRRHTRLQGDWSSDVCSSDLLMSLPRVSAAGENDINVEAGEFKSEFGEKFRFIVRGSMLECDVLSLHVSDSRSRSEERRVGKECSSCWWRCA